VAFGQVQPLKITINCLLEMKSGNSWNSL